MDQVDRVCERKLGHIKPEVLKTKVNKNGEFATVSIANQFHKNGPTKSRLNTKFWISFWTQFDFMEDIANSLPEPPEDEEVPEELLENIGIARADNPPDRNPRPLTLSLKDPLAEPPGWCRSCVWPKPTGWC